MRIVTGDVGGTNARFAIADLSGPGLPMLSCARNLRVTDHPDLASAWRVFAKSIDEPLPPRASMGLATPFDGPCLKFTNSPWTVDRQRLAAQLGIEEVFLLNDFGAIAHTAAEAREADFRRLFGPKFMAGDEVATVVGPGTGLGVSMIVRRGDVYSVIETEAAHGGFSPSSEREEEVALYLRARFGRCSIERVVSGPGLRSVLEALGKSWPGDDASLWETAITGGDKAVDAALALWLGAFGGACGDLALAQGSNQVILSGSLATRLADRLKDGEFREAFLAKGRYRDRMSAMPVRLLTMEDAGLIGAALAFRASATAP